MGNITRVRVEVKNKYNDNYRNFKEMFSEFKRRVSSAGILADLKDHQFYESKSDKARKKKKETIAKYRSEMIEEKLLAGETVNASAGLIKKIKAKQNKKDIKDNKKKDYRNKDR